MFLSNKEAKTMIREYRYNRLSGTLFSWRIFEGDRLITRIKKTLRFLIKGNSGL